MLEASPLLKTKATVVAAGPSQLLVLWSLIGLSLEVLSGIFLNSN